MNINKALEHFEWRLKNHWKGTRKDIEAYNSILDYKDLQETKIINQHESLAKLWIEKMILLSHTKLYDGEACIQEIDAILDKSVYEWCCILQLELPMMRFSSIGSSKYPVDKISALNRTKIAEINKKIVDEYETELTEAFKYEISEENIIKFVEGQMNRIINKYEK